MTAPAQTAAPTRLSALAEIETLAGEYSRARDVLQHLVQELEDTITSMKRAALPDIRAAAGIAAEHRGVLEAAIRARADLFEKPRTHVFHGVKLGILKGKGVIEWDDGARVCQLIHQKMPDLAEVLIDTKIAPSKKALGQLTVAQLKTIGVRVVESGDEVVIKDAASELDKLLDALTRDDLGRVLEEQA